VAVVSHVDPDADAIGSVIGLAGALRALGKDVVAALSDPIPEYARFLVGAADVVSVLPESPFDVYLFADAADLERIGTIYSSNAERFADAPLIDLDHHRTNPLFGTVNVVDAAASSTSELAFCLLKALGAPIDRSTATALLFGIVGDTGSFRNGATTPGSLAAAAELVDVGADVQAIAFELFERKRFDTARLWGEVLAGLELLEDRRMVVGWISQAMLAAHGANVAETEGIVAYLRGIEEADVAILLKETEEGDVKVSMRSRPHIDVSTIASALGGGGHRQAAGCTVPGPRARAQQLLIETYDRFYGQ
jgi:phosphoesterase RecJ-like protein